MNLENTKCVIVIDEHQPTGLIANTAAILGLTLGKEVPELVGPDITDADGNTHKGVILLPLPILRGNPDLLKELAVKLHDPAFAEVNWVGFTDLAQSCNTYGEYEEKMAKNSLSDLNYMGLAMCGPKKLINKLSGSLPLLR